MDTKYMIDMLYKQAAEEEEPTNMVRGGAALGGLMGATSSMSKQMGPKYTGGVSNKQGDKLMRADDKLFNKEMKAWKKGGKVGPKPEFKPVNSKGISKIKFGERLGNLGSSLKGGGWKGMLGRTALGAGAMALGGGALTALDNYGKRVEASEIIDELYKEATFFEPNDEEKQKYIDASKAAHDAVVNFRNKSTVENLDYAINAANMKALHRAKIDNTLSRKIFGRRIYDPNIDMNEIIYLHNGKAQVNSFAPESVEWNKNYFLKKKPGYIITNSTKKQASEIIDELYKEAQSDIKCQKCGYEGKPNYNGTCPKCGLTLGQYEPEGPCGDNYRHTRENPINDFTVEELVEKAQAEEWSY